MDPSADPVGEDPYGTTKPPFRYPEGGLFVVVPNAAAPRLRGGDSEEAYGWITRRSV